MPVTAIPVFPHVKFCHGAVVVHSGSGIEGPEDLRGKRVGLQAHFNPIAVWMRGVLKHEHGVSPDEMRWVTNSDEQVRDPRRSYLAWYGEAVEEDEKVLGRDPFPYSVEAQRHALDTMLLYAAEQAVTTRRLSVEELFVPSTLG